MGSFTAKEAKKASHSQVCTSGAKAKVSSTVMSDVPACRYMNTMAASMKSEPSSV